MSSSEHPPTAFGAWLRGKARGVADEFANAAPGDERATLAATLRDLIVAAEVADRHAVTVSGDTTAAAEFGVEVTEAMRQHLLASRVQYVKAPDGQVLDVAQATGPQIATAYWQVVAEWQEAAARVPQVVSAAVDELSRVRGLYAGRDDRASQRQYDLLSQSIAQIESLGAG